MTRQKAPWSFAAVDIEVPSSGTREVLLTRASGDWTGWTVDGVTAPASVTDELTVTAPSSLLGRRWRLLDPDGRERIVGCVVAAKAGSASEDLTVDVSTGATIVEVTIAGGGGGGAVDSVNGETGVVVLDAADVGAVPVARTITAGTGLTGGGDLSADRTLTVTFGATAGTAAEGNDARLSDARTPTAHAASHQDGGSDELALDGSQITTGTVAAARLGSGTASAGTVLHGDGAWRRGHVDAVANAATFPGNAPIGPNHAPTFASASHSLGAVGHEAYVPFFCPVGTYDSIGLNVTATAASTWRIGVADMASTGWPGEILLDAGTLDMSSATGWRALAIGFVVDRPRWMWMQVKCTAYTAAPTVTCLDGISSASSSPRLPGWPVYGSLLARAFVGCRTIQNRGSGPLDPAAPMTNGDAGAGLGFNQIMPLIVMRRSA